MNFKLAYDPVTETASIRLENGRDLAEEKYSGFGIMNETDFAEWYRILPSECRGTANSQYSFAFAGPEIHALLMNYSLFEQDKAYCISFNAEEPVIPIGERIRYALNCGMPKRQVQIYCPGELRGKLTNLDFCLFKYKETPDEADIVIMDGRFPERLVSTFSADISRSFTAIIHAGPGKGLSVEKVEGRVVHLYGDPMHCVLAWCRDVLMPETIRQFAEKAPQKDRTVILAAQPMVKLDGLPQPNETVKVGDVLKIRLTKFPETVRCRLSYSGVTVRPCDGGLSVQMAEEGMGSIALSITGYPELPREEYNFYISQDHPVTGIGSVHFPSKPFSVGDIRDVSAVFIPANATNTADAVWRVAPSDAAIISGISPDGKSAQILARKEGPCQIIVSVGNVQKKLEILVSPQPEGLGSIVMPKRIKIGKSGQNIETQILPAGSLEGELRFQSDDPAVIRVDSNGDLYPGIPGPANITVELVYRGQVVDSKNVAIEVIPQYPEPDLLQFIGIGLCMLEAALFLHHRELCIYPMIPAVSALVVSTLKSKTIPKCLASVAMGVAAILAGMPL